MLLSKDLDLEDQAPRRAAMLEKKDIVVIASSLSLLLPECSEKLSSKKSPDNDTERLLDHYVDWV